MAVADSNPPLADWHARYRQQAGWTRPLRDYFFQQVASRGLQIRRVLEVGCGTGALLEELAGRGIPEVSGLDISAEHLSFSRRLLPDVGLVQADAAAAPLPDAYFDLVCCHFLLLWVPNPVQVLREMLRLVRPGGVIAAFAEPDYGGRIDHPAPLSRLGDWQIQSLRRQGADPLTGRKLGQYFHQAGLPFHAGILGAQWNSAGPPSGHSERAVLLSDLAWLQPPPDSAEVDALLTLNASAQTTGERILFIPTFYAWGEK